MNAIMIVAAAALAATLAAGNAEAHYSYRCPKVATPPVIDGKLDDEAWKNAPEVTLVMAVTAEPATKKTTAKMCYDDHAIYIAWDCVDTDVWATMTKRNDAIWREEVVEAFINPTCDLVNYFEINVNPLNTIFQGKIINPDGVNPSDKSTLGYELPGLQSAVQVDGTVHDRTDVDRGWTVELAVPFAAMKTPTPKPGDRWRLNLYRIDLDPKPREFQAWSPTLLDPVHFHVPARFGTVFFGGPG